MIRESLLLVDGSRFSGGRNLFSRDLVINPPPNVLGVGLAPLTPPGVAGIGRIGFEFAINVDVSNFAKETR